MSVECQFCNTYYNKFTKVMDDFPKSSDVSKTTQRNPLEMSALSIFLSEYFLHRWNIVVDARELLKKRVCSNNP